MLDLILQTLAITVSALLGIIGTFYLLAGIYELRAFVKGKLRKTLKQRVQPDFDYARWKAEGEAFIAATTTPPPTRPMNEFEKAMYKGGPTQDQA